MTDFPDSVRFLAAIMAGSAFLSSPFLLAEETGPSEPVVQLGQEPERETLTLSAPGEMLSFALPVAEVRRSTVEGLELNEVHYGMRMFLAVTGGDSRFGGGSSGTSGTGLGRRCG